MGNDALVNRDEAQAGRDGHLLVHPLQVARAPRSRQRQDHAADEGDESADGHALRHESDDLRRIQSHRLELADSESDGSTCYRFGCTASGPVTREESWSLDSKR